MASSIRRRSVCYVVRYRETWTDNRVIWTTNVFLDRDNAVLFMADLDPWNKAEMAAHIFFDVEQYAAVNVG